MGDHLSGFSEMMKLASAHSNVTVGVLDVPAAWSGSKRRQITVNLKFVGENNPETEVYNPIRQLLWWSLGSPAQGFGDQLGGWAESVAEKYGSGVSLAQYRPSKVGYVIADNFSTPLITGTNTAGYGSIIIQCQPNWEPPETAFNERGYPYYATCMIILEDLFVPFKNRPYTHPGVVSRSSHVMKYER